MERALARQRDGELVAARQAYQDVLDEAPLTHDALHMLAVVELNLGRVDQAAYYLREASSLRADYPAIKTNRDLIEAAMRARDADHSKTMNSSMRTRTDAQVVSPMHMSPASAAPALTLSHGAEPRRDAVCHVIGLGTRSVDDDDGGWFVARLFDVLQPLRPTFWSTDESQARLVTDRSLSTRRVCIEADAFPRVGTLFVVGADVDIGEWLPRSQLTRVILFCERGGEAEYDALASRLQSVTGVPVERILRSTRLQRIVGTKGHVCLPPVVLPDVVNIDEVASRDDRFVIGSVAEREESLMAPHGGQFWLDLASADMRVLLRGANRLRQSLGAAEAIEIHSRQLEPLASFIRRLDCLVYAVRDPADEGWGVDLFTAMALGVPVLCSARSCYSSYIDHGINGFIFRDEREALTFARRLRDDRSLHTRVGETGAVWARTAFADAAMRQQYASVTSASIQRIADPFGA